MLDTPKIKITAEVPQALLDKAMRATGEGITRTLCEGLERIARTDAYEKFRALRGKVKPKYSLKVLRYDGE